MKRKERKKCLVLLLCVCAVVTMLPLTAKAGELTVSEEASLLLATAREGNFGDSNQFHWQLAADGTLTITGTGAMPNSGEYDYTYAPWRKDASLKNSITKIVIQEGITRIGNYAFIGCQNLRQAVLPTSLTRIGRAAFFDCRNLVLTELPANLTHLEEEAFCGCYSLALTKLPSNLSVIEMYVFDSCYQLALREFPASLTEIGYQAFYGCISLTSLTFRSKTAPIMREEIFLDCTGLSEIHVPVGATGYEVLTKQTGIPVRADIQEPKLPGEWMAVYEGKQRFAALLYENALRREAEPSEIAYWEQELSGGREGAEVAYGFLFSEEFRNHDYNNADYVEHLYLSLMGRASDEGGKADWVTHLENGVSREYVFKQFVDSAEFDSLCQTYGILRGQVMPTEARDQNYNVTRFVARNYSQFLGRGYDEQGLNDWCGRINSRTQTMQEIAFGFVFSAECEGKNLSNQEFVEMLYRGCFDRNGEAEGVNGWVSELASGAKNRMDVFYGFANSQEFFNMVQSYGL
ncbi:MAG: DUF4214 domain-containing protein [Clostridiales bacterium]|nr:DUF4214 domain-containing protein [Clostridiales bacterium]